MGRILELLDDNLVLIAWDSITLKNIPQPVIEKCEEECWEWEKVYLDSSDILLSPARDSEEDAKNTLNRLKNAYEWDFLGEASVRIKSVLSTISLYDEEGALNAWEQHFKETLNFPFKAVVNELHGSQWAIRVGNEVSVQKICGIEERFGVLVDIEYKGKKLKFPLADLEVTENISANYLPVRDYVVWFANS